MRVELKTRVELDIHCPECGVGVDRIDHIEVGGHFGPWYCDACGFGFLGVRTGQREAEVEAWRDRKVRTVVTLRSTEPVTLLVEGMRFVGPEWRPEEYESQRRYFYEEHSCPANHLRHAIDVKNDAGEKDPHGIFAFVSVRDASPEELDDA